MATEPKAVLSKTEFVAMTALLISLVALSIDAMLPALPHIGADLGVNRPNDNQLVVSSLFIGLAVGQMIYGPLSDSWGRKPAIYLGIAVYSIGCVGAMFAQSFEAMLAFRVLQGIGAASPRIVLMAMIRDLYEGRVMAQIMSFIMTVFILVPALAPLLGQGILYFGDWRTIFAVFLLVALGSTAWFALRQTETLDTAHRAPLSLASLRTSATTVLSHRETMGYTIATGFVFGPFLGYLNSAQQIFQVQFGTGAMFPPLFAILALTIGAASLLNARLVIRYGMRRLSVAALQTATLVSVIYLLAFFVWHGAASLPGLMVYLATVFFCMGMLFGNLSALAMEPMGRVAGVAAALVGFLSTIISVPLGVVIGQAYNGTVVPLVAGFIVLCAGALVLVGWAARARVARDGATPDERSRL